MNKSVKWFLQGFMLFVANTRSAHAETCQGVRTPDKFEITTECVEDVRYLRGNKSHVSRTEDRDWVCERFGADKWLCKTETITYTTQGLLTNTEVCHGKLKADGNGHTISFRPNSTGMMINQFEGEIRLEPYGSFENDGIDRVWHHTIMCVQKLRS